VEKVSLREGLIRPLSYNTYESHLLRKDGLMRYSLLMKMGTDQHVHVIH